MNSEEQISLPLNYGKDIIKICDLKREETPLVSRVKIDEFTDEANKNFDFDFNGEIKFYPFEVPQKLKKLDFNILCIVGASGSGKSTFSKHFGKEEQLEYDNNKSIMSHFESPNEAIEKLCAVGLSSIPTWCKPRNVLSIGEGFRVDLARRLKDGCVIDEFTSTVDRKVALSCCASISKYIRKNNIKKCVFVSCHKDFIDVLCPDYVIDLDDMALYDTRRLPRRKFELQIYSRDDKQQIWNIFRQHHYLSGDFNKASNMYVGELNGEIVAMCGILPQPNGYCTNGFRIHRLVVLPDYQGLGIGKTLLEWACEYYNKQNKIMYIRTTHIKLANALKKSSKWKETARSGKVSPDSLWVTNKKRTPYSFKYIKNNIKNEKSYFAINKRMTIFDLESKGE